MEGVTRTMEPTQVISPVAQVSIFKRGQDVQLSQNFHLREIECRCGKCPITLIDLEHIERLEQLRKIYQKPIHIHSAFRCPEYNISVGGTKNSQHCLGLATDIHIDGVDTYALYSTSTEIFDGVGVYDSFVHVDSRGQEARWDFRGKNTKDG